MSVVAAKKILSNMEIYFIPIVVLFLIRHQGVDCQSTGRKLRKAEVPESGEGNDSRIVGGHDAKKGRYPSIVALFDSYGFYKCGGTLILPDVVLSAAHCANHVHRIEVGRYDISKSIFEEGAQFFEITSKSLHPQYGKHSLYQNDMDFALFKLSGKGAEHAQTATLNGDSNFPGSQEVPMTVAGWGTTSEGGSVSNVLQEVEVFTMPNKKCESKYSAYQGALTKDMMCATVQGGGKDACQGDSGGPGYHLSSNDDPNKDLLLGIVSWGVGCGRGEYPGIYGRVAHPEVLKWITDTACELSGHTPCHLKVHKPTSGTSVGVSKDSKSPSSTGTTTSSISNGSAGTTSWGQTFGDVKKPKKTNQPLEQKEKSQEIKPDGGCYVKDGALEAGTCAISEDVCGQCNGIWLKKFPSCFIEQYGYSSKIEWCLAKDENCKQCGGIFFKSPPTLMNHERRRL